MVIICKISKYGKLLKIKEVSDIYRYKEFNFDENQ